MSGSVNEMIKAMMESVASRSVDTKAISKMSVDGTEGPNTSLLLYIFYGLLNGILVRVLKDDGCNTNIVSKRISDHFEDQF